ncbi:hypothetical protein D3C85_683830 [compost metagenome]
MTARADQDDGPAALVVMLQPVKHLQQPQAQLQRERIAPLRVVHGDDGHLAPMLNLDDISVFAHRRLLIGR